MIIEQDQRQLQEAVAFHRNADIRSIRLAQSRVWSQPLSVLSKPENLNFDISFDPGELRSDGTCLAVETDFKLSVTDNSNDRTPMIVIECKFEAEYELSPGFSPSENQIEAFRAANAIFNCWPFFREYVLNTAARMSFPPPPIPFLRIIRKQPPAETPPVVTAALEPTVKRIGTKKRLR
jgi:hypothetical protein